MKQKVVIKVSMNASSSRFYCFGPQSSRCKAMRVATGFEGVQSVVLVGDDKDRLEVIGERVDPVKLTTLLRKNVGSAEIVTVSVVDAKDKKESGSKDKVPIMWPYFVYFQELDPTFILSGVLSTVRGLLG